MVRRERLAGLRLGPYPVLPWFTFSRWATEAYAATANLAGFPALRKIAEYAHTQANLLAKWGVLAGASALFMSLAAERLARCSRSE